MTTQITQHYWWTMFVRGGIALLFVLTVFFLTLAVAGLVHLVGVYMLLDGLVLILVAMQGRQFLVLWWLFLLEGILGVALSMPLLIWQNMSVDTLFTFIAIRAILTAIFEFAATFSAYDMFSGGWLLVLGAIISLMLGILCLYIQPVMADGLIAAIGVVGCYVLVCGVVWMICAFQVRWV